MNRRIHTLLKLINRENGRAKRSTTRTDKVFDTVVAPVPTINVNQRFSSGAERERATPTAKVRGYIEYYMCAVKYSRKETPAKL